MFKLRTLLFIVGLAFGQPDRRYNPFDWVLFGQTGNITSITEGFSFYYLGTELGGISRIHRYGYNLDDPISIAQGLKDNRISAVYFDKNTGTLWAATPEYLQYSHTREGDWFQVRVDNWGLPENSRIRNIGSSRDYLWINTGSMYIKLDHISGIMISVMSHPDEVDITWSSGPLFVENSLFEKLNSYSLSDGWMITGNEVMSPEGRMFSIKNMFIGTDGDVILVAGNQVFIGDNRLKFLTPLNLGLGNSDVQFIIENNTFILGGRQNQNTIGFTQFNTNQRAFFIDDFETNINLNVGSYYCATVAKNEIWYGGQGFISIYNREDDFWRTLDETRGFSGKVITNLVSDSNYVWVASSSGLARIHQQKKRSQSIGFEKYFTHVYIYDLERIHNLLWIASDYDLTIADLDEQTLINFKDLGDLGDMKGLENLLSGFKVLEQFEQEMMVGTNQGVWSYHMDRHTWIQLVDPSVYAGRVILKMARFGTIIFLATDSGFIRYDLNNHFIREYHYSIIESINEMVVDEENLWLGTPSGLVKFNWTID